VIARELARWVLDLRYEDIDAETEACCRELVLDHLGTAARGGVMENMPSVDATLAALGAGQGDVLTAVVGKAPARPEWAVFTNSIAAHSVELDDTHSASSLHPAVVVIPGALAAGQIEGSSGRDVIAAIVAGYEVACRLGRALTAKEVYAKGFHPTAIVGPFSTAAAVGKLIGLDEEQLAHAFGIAASQAAGRTEFLAEGAWTKRLHPGWSSHAGYVAAHLAKHGFTGPLRPFDGRDGLLRGYGSEAALARLTQGLGQPFELAITSVKPHACCRYNQGPIDLAIGLREQHGIGPDDIEAIEVGVVTAAIGIVVEPRDRKVRPTNDVDAQFSLPYAVGLGIAKGRASLDEYAPEVLDDAAVLAVAARTTAVVKPEFDARYPDLWPCDMVVTTTDGRTLTASLEHAKGDPENRLGYEGMCAKFRSLASSVFDDAQMDAIIAAVDDLADGGVGPIASAVGR
jgi:2-methylcitrate dehydratase PrpD